MSDSQTTIGASLEPLNNKWLANLCGQHNEHLSQLEERFVVTIKNRGNHFNVSGEKPQVNKTVDALNELYALAEHELLTPALIHLRIQEGQTADANAPPPSERGVIYTPRKSIKPRGINQHAYVKSIAENDVVFGVGPAGTGKTYLAVACAVEALERDEVRRIVLARPAVEAGERLGFLPGDLSEKINPYLMPLYDALYEMLGNERVEKLIEKNVIEIAPLAFMRGRTLSEAFIILDEAQNTTPKQIKMFLTRIGYGSTVVVTGDITQIDLPNHVESGLCLALRILQNIDGISFSQFEAKDIMRHPIVQKIVTAYDSHKEDES
ncbi:MAG: phosphate starvation-inducible protein PhoH [Cycloclasticus sp. symbiont of Poecilosclerida sp. M]|nr:MAG: phosphate starvation-inducible protein PhoH [Cycloclasticus sp. symbiont of Poecilosclerida sp. M]